MTIGLAKKTALAAAILAILQGCEPAPAYFDTIGGGVNPNDLCGSASLQYLVGKPQAAAVNLGTDRPMRIIGASDVITLDHNPRRLNIQLDDAGNIATVSCG